MQLGLQHMQCPVTAATRVCRESLAGRHSRSTENSCACQAQLDNVFLTSQKDKCLHPKSPGLEGDSLVHLPAHHCSPWLFSEPMSGSGLLLLSLSRGTCEPRASACWPVLIVPEPSRASACSVHQDFCPAQGHAPPATSQIYPTVLAAAWIQLVAAHLLP